MQQQFDERNRDLLIGIDGHQVHRDQAGISPFDSAVQGGDAVWEGLRLYDGRIFKLREHLDRLRAKGEVRVDPALSGLRIDRVAEGGFELSQVSQRQALGGAHRGQRRQR